MDTQACEHREYDDETTLVCVLVAGHAGDHELEQG